MTQTATTTTAGVMPDFVRDFILELAAERFPGIPLSSAYSHRAVPNTVIQPGDLVIFALTDEVQPSEVAAVPMPKGGVAFEHAKPQQPTRGYVIACGQP